MATTNEAEHYFQTDAAISESHRKSTKSKNIAGNPIRLKSKLLAVTPDPFNSSAVYVAEATGSLRRVVVKTSETSHVLRPSTTSPSPLTCLTIAVTSSNAGCIFAGCWDKHIYVWSISSSFPTQLASKVVLKHHTDFVKAIVARPARSTSEHPLVISASADKSIAIWDAVTLEKLHVLTGHTRGVQALALDPCSLSQSSEQDQYSFIFASGDSNREIRFWHISAQAAREIDSQTASAGEGPETFDDAQTHDAHVVHETSIYALQYSDCGDLWTASADKTVKRLAREQGFSSDTVLQHSDYVKALAIDERLGLVITAGRNEDVVIWQLTTGKTIAVLRGHWEEITGLALLADSNMVVSVSIDGTLRSWGLCEADFQKALESYEALEHQTQKTEIALTADELRELEDLMDSDED